MINKNFAYCALGFVSIVGCNAGKGANGVDGGVTASVAVDTDKRVIQGRCENETTDTPYGSLYFYPSKGELFTTVGDFAQRIPVTVVKTEPNKVSFAYKWASKGDDLGTTANASVSWIGTQKWSFDFEGLKDSICHTVEDNLFYKKLTELGIAPGKYLDSKDNDMITIVADSQKLINEVKGETVIWYYRVRSQSGEAGITLYTSNEAPSDSKNKAWSNWNISKSGEDFLITYNGKMTRAYSPVK